MQQIYGIKTKIQKFTWYTENIFSLYLYSPEIAQNAHPGQFVMIRDDEWRLNPFLNRPMSIARVDSDSNLFELQILVTGKGTRQLSNLKKDAILYTIGPLGNSFEIPAKTDQIALVAGGIGIAPLIYFHEEIKNTNPNITFFYGAASQNDLIPDQYLPVPIRHATDDGSKGFNGFVTKDLTKFLEKNKINKIYACGPNPMLKAVQQIALKNNIFCEISIETIMACGFGICQGCIVPKKDNPNQYYLTCMDGPVFNAKEITFD